MKKAPRYKRNPELVGGLRLQKRDLTIIKLVHDYRFLNSEQIQALVPGSDQVILRRLQKLFHHGYLDRPISQIAFSNPLFGHQNMIYGLGDKGADIIAEKFGIDRGNIIWKEKNKEVRERYLQHTLMISKFRACLSQSLRNFSEIDIGFWMRENSEELRKKEHVYFVEDGRNRRLSVAPDGFFSLEDQKSNMYFFLEADRSTMTNSRFLNKMKAYWQWWLQKGHTKRFGINSFRVLTITKTERRKENLRRITSEADDKQTGSLMFWFACNKNFSLENPGEILKPIWQTPKDDLWHSILE